MKLRHRIGARLRRWLERAAGRFYEGPEAPARYVEQAHAFALQSPPLCEWERFAGELAEVAYREGYVRGVEHQVRTPGMIRMVGEAEARAEEELRHGWSLAARAPRLADVLRATDPADPLSALPDDRGRMAALEAMGHHQGFQVVYLNGDERLPKPPEVRDGGQPVGRG